MSDQVFEYWLMKFILVSFCIFTINNLPLLAQTTQGTASDTGVTWHLFSGVDYLGIGNDNSGLTPNPNNICSYYLAHNGPPFGTPCTYSSRAYGAEGVRIAFYHDLGSFEFGPSIGYFNGGPGAGRINVYASNPAINVNIFDQANITESADTLRLLAEARKAWGVTGGFGVRLGAGLGVASVNQTISCSDVSNTNSNACLNFGLPRYSTLGWITWEFSPSVIYKNLSLGLRYVGFARGEQIPWNTFGGFFGVDF